ncbi:cytochrome c oxidase subunit II [soil metagenome]
MWDFPLFPRSASTTAPLVDSVYIAVMAVAVAFSLVVCALIIFFAIRYRRGSQADRTNPITSDLRLELTFVGIPTILGIGLFTYSALIYFNMYNPPGDSIDVYVIGKQWMWKVQHPEGTSEINELHVPLGRPVRLVMTSQDVIHSFFIPDFRVKMDVLPGRYTQLWFEPTKVGTYRLFCAEYCGTDHSRMGGLVHVMEPAEYEAWLDGATRNLSMAAEGERLFRQYHCSGCHGENASVRAPRLEGVYGGPVPITDKDGSNPRIIRADDRYLRDSILLPDREVVAGYEPIMPSFAGQINDEDLLKIIAYIKSIGRGSGRRPSEARGERVGEDYQPEFVGPMGRNN